MTYTSTAMASVLVSLSLGQAGPQPDPAVQTLGPIPAAQIRDQWILDGRADMTVLGEHELKIVTPKPFQTTIWYPAVFEGPVEVQFDAMVPEGKPKLLVMAYAHGSDARPVWTWKRKADYDDYNAGPMELYTLGFNRGEHTSKKLGGQLANVRRIGGPTFAKYTFANFKKNTRAFWEQWNRDSLLGAAREPASGLGKHLHYRITFDPPLIRMEVDGVAYCELVDHRPNPLCKGAFGFRNMTRGSTMHLRNVVLRGKVTLRRTP